jgi:hypothetical protein
MAKTEAAVETRFSLTMAAPRVKSNSSQASINYRFISLFSTSIKIKGSIRCELNGDIVSPPEAYDFML